MLPVDYLPIDIPPVLRAKGGPADETLKHDCPERPLCSGQLALVVKRASERGGMFAYPVTVKRVTVARQYLRCNVCDELVACRGALKGSGESYSLVSRQQNKPSAGATSATH